MKCPKCGSEKSKVTDSRPIGPLDSIYRRRKCQECQERWTTYEISEEYLTFETEEVEEEEE